MNKTTMQEIYEVLNKEYKEWLETEEGKEAAEWWNGVKVIHNNTKHNRDILGTWVIEWSKE